MQGTPGNALFEVSYFGPEGNVTAGIVSGTYRTAAIDDDDGAISIRMVVVPNKKKLVKKKRGKTKVLKKSFRSLLRAESTAFSSAGDTGTISVGVR